jgi:cbb3-type cytochrome oxidase maturation protein
MSIVVMQVFVSLVLVAGSLVLFLHSVRQRDFDHADRLALAPLDDDAAPDSQSPTTAPTDAAKSPCKQSESNTTTP